MHYFNLVRNFNRARTSWVVLSLMTLATIGLAPAIGQASPVTNPMVKPLESELSVRWEPLARVNASKPVTIVLNNNTPETLEYLITTHTDFRRLAPGASSRVIVADFPTFLNVNAQRTVGVKYRLTVDKNQVTLDLKVADDQGDTTLNIDQTGAIYLY
ncbi:MAG: hypothetical protein RLZZ511_4414 [Cyanobacteriota bacterium]|jgi:hypothetical protein